MWLIDKQLYTPFWLITSWVNDCRLHWLDQYHSASGEWRKVHSLCYWTACLNSWFLSYDTILCGVCCHCVHLSIRPSHAGIVPEWLNIGSPLPVPLNDFECHVCCFKPFKISYLVKHSTNLLRWRIARYLCSSWAFCNCDLWWPSLHCVQQCLHACFTEFHLQPAVHSSCVTVKSCVCNKPMSEFRVMHKLSVLVGIQ